MNQLGGVDYENTIFSPRWFLENCLWIVDKDANLVRFKLNREQDLLLRHVEICLANSLPVRILLLKARQIGATTFFTALGFWYAAMHTNAHYGIVAHRLDSAQSIFDKCKLFYNNLEPALRPATTQFSSEGIKFDKKGGRGINSKISFATVNEGVYRGQTLGFLHLTELAFWDSVDVRAVENSLSPTVPDKPFTFIIRESTANGYNHFKSLWDRTMQGEETNYTPFFFGWQDHEEYRRRVPPGFQLTEREMELKERFGLTDEQIAWRRYQIETNYDGNEEAFRQEFPMTPEEAFIAAGAGVFAAETIQRGYELAREPERVAIQSVPVHEKLLVWERPEEREEKVYAKKAEWSYEKQEYVYVDTELLLEKVRYKTPYTIGVDTSGLGADWNQVVVINNITKAMAARFGIKTINDEELAKIVVEIARMYNDALIAPEVNFSHEICNYILKLGYENVYFTENIQREDIKVVSVTYGWRTTGKTKPAMISLLRSRLKENPGLIPDKGFWYEAEYYIIENTQRNVMNAASGHHDDIIIATAIAMYVSDSMQTKQSPVVVKERLEIPENSVFGRLLGYEKKRKAKLKKGLYSNHA